jgi:hypothetical protein
MCQAIEEMRQDSRNEGIEQGIELTRLESIHVVMTRLKCTAQQAMDFLMIPYSEQSKYLAKL